MQQDEQEADCVDLTFRSSSKLAHEIIAFTPPDPSDQLPSRHLMNTPPEKVVCHETLSPDSDCRVISPYEQRRAMRPVIPSSIRTGALDLTLSGAADTFLSSAQAASEAGLVVLSDTETEQNEDCSEISMSLIERLRKRKKHVS
jgi:hypothetical protein